MKKIAFIVGFFISFSLPLFNSLNAFAGSLVIEVPDDPEPTTEVTTYQCGTGTSKEHVEVTYLNAGSISLVDFKWQEKRIIASRSISASGAKYMGGPYIWWTKGNEATLSDLINDPEEKNLIQCVEEQKTE
ncbi:MliC family protein [Bartonella krasnovii]|uniref:Membrane-bound lysozyme inhibitor of C-type lysozyme n=1 Tax=Bartonella krasnovii TaxID=2267275 RepID=A0A5B9D373_9HYPH|nr:MliC family protein [Bartonella krasnovii]QEE12966.1 membrane-bound lysozyme inhibitor of C-type lysozyme [Bartonella krasnovii]UNF29087.1 MliC family protein [Bartonella krasnovii]UNF35444.1 MliC family protein [Bartonella krasnovii]UNF37058.1 MliC family protein [Bartonella krasnovii]UNF38758.1 MliC family protein [Bartonella krasnovii]